MANHLSVTELETLAEAVRLSPADAGTLDLIVARPDVDCRTVLDHGELDVAVGLVGDNWRDRPSSRTADGGPHPDMQLNLINSRFSDGIASGDQDLRALAGDQLHVDLDLSEANVPAGSRLSLGEAVIEITEQPHTGCAKFSQRFGVDAQRFTRTEIGNELKLRGVNAKVVSPGRISRGDTVRKLNG